MARPPAAVRRVYRDLREWVLLDASRLAVTAGILGVVFLVLSAPGVLETTGGWNDAGITTLFGSLLSGNLTVITVVLSINQLVLSRELRTPEEIRTDMGSAIEFRDDVAADLSERPGAESFSTFLHRVLGNMRATVADLEAAAEDDPAEDHREATTGLAASLDARIEEMDALLTEPDVDLFTALSTTLRYDFAREFDRARWLSRAEADALDDDVLAALEGVQRDIRHLEVARQYAKTLHVQAELASLSRLLLYVGLAAILTSVLVIASQAPPAGLPLEPTIRVAVTVTLAPLAVLLAFVLRIATIAQRTAAFVPFGTPK